MGGDLQSEVQLWSWGFLALYVALMVYLGMLGQRSVKKADDFATARHSYGPLFLAFAFSATTASGATFLGIPGLAYETGLPILWITVGYPIGVYIGVLICLNLVSRVGDNFGSRTIPEYLGDRYQSDAIRLIVALFSLLMFFYLAGQLISGLVMFEKMLGLPPLAALVITTLILLFYVVMGGAHSDILTDGVQGAMMLLLALGVAYLFFTGFGVDGGFNGMLDRLLEVEPYALSLFNPEQMLVASGWAAFAVIVSHIPLGMLPHLGNKLWALKSKSSKARFLGISFTFSMILPLMALGGILARVVLGDVLFDGSHSSNEAVPLLFISMFPAWLAAFLGIGILAAVMSTADGLVISTAQIFANDLYRRTFARRWQPEISVEKLDHNVLLISRWATVLVLLVSALLAWVMMEINITLVVWVGIGGMMAALVGPLLLGSVWSGVTKSGALSGLLVGPPVFLLLHAGWIPPAGDSSGLLDQVLGWLQVQSPNPYACTTIAELLALGLTIGVSLYSKPLPQEHLHTVFAKKTGPSA